MASFNKVILIGNLTRDPSLKWLASQAAVAEFGLAVMACAQRLPALKRKSRGFVRPEKRFFHVAVDGTSATEKQFFLTASLVSSDVQAILLLSAADEGLCSRPRRRSLERLIAAVADAITQEKKRASGRSLT